MFELSENC